MRRLTFTVLMVLAICLATGPAWAAKGPAAPMSSDEPIHVVADQLEVDNKGQVATFLGKVKAVQGDVTITCDRLDVHYDREPAENQDAVAQVGITDEGGRVKKVVAEGHVKITQKDRVAVGRKATYWAGGRKMLLEGKATVWKGKNQVSGDKITVFLDQDRSIVHGKPGKRVSVTFVPKKGDKQ